MNEKLQKSIIAAILWTAGYVACLIVTGHNGALFGAFGTGLGVIFGFGLGTKYEATKNWDQGSTDDENVDHKTIR